jgi:hypothetical protein
MDFLDPKKKRAHRIRLFIGYGLMAIAIAIGTTVLVFEAYGFDLDRKTGEVIQNGLVFVDAHPESADVYLNGEPKGRTDTRLVIPAGKYTLELKRAGYRSWKRSFTLEGSSIERFVYPFLFPENLKTQDVQLYATTPHMATQSPDRRWVVIQQPGTLTSFDVLDLSTEATETKTVTLPANLLHQAGTKHTLEMVEWSTDNRHVLLKHSFDGGFEFVVFDRETPAASINLNAVFNLPISDVALRDKKPDQFYLYDQNGGILRRADAKTAKTELLQSSVQAFKPHGSDVILFVTTQGAPAGKALVRIQSGNNLYTLRELPTDKKYLLEVARYDGRWYMAAGSSAEQKVYVYQDPFDALQRSDPARRIPVPVSVLKLDVAPQYLSFSATARFIALQGGSRFAVYDAETDRSSRYDIKLKLDPAQKISWMDGHRFATVSEGKVVVFDYDGINKQTLVAANPAYLPLFDRDYNNLFAIGPSVVVPGRTALTRTSMKVKNP